MSSQPDEPSADEQRRALADLLDFMVFAYNQDSNYKGTAQFHLKRSDGEIVDFALTADPETGVHYTLGKCDHSPSCAVSMSVDDFLHVYSGKVGASQLASMCWSGSIKVHGMAFRALSQFASSFNYSSETWEAFYRHQANKGAQLQAENDVDSEVQPEEREGEEKAGLQDAQDQEGQVRHSHATSAQPHDGSGGGGGGGGDGDGADVRSREDGRDGDASEGASSPSFGLARPASPITPKWPLVPSDAVEPLLTDLRLPPALLGHTAGQNASPALRRTLDVSKQSTTLAIQTPKRASRRIRQLLGMGPTPHSSPSADAAPTPISLPTGIPPLLALGDARVVPAPSPGHGGGDSVALRGLLLRQQQALQRLEPQPSPIHARTTAALHHTAPKPAKFLFPYLMEGVQEGPTGSACPHHHAGHAMLRRARHDDDGEWAQSYAVRPAVEQYRHRRRPRPSWKRHHPLLSEIDSDTEVPPQVDALGRAMRARLAQLRQSLRRAGQSQDEWWSAPRAASLGLPHDGGALNRDIARHTMRLAVKLQETARLHAKELASPTRRHGLSGDLDPTNPFAHPPWA